MKIEPMTIERMGQIEEHARTYGPANGWSGTTGTLSTMIIELLHEVARLQRDLNAAERDAMQRGVRL